MKKILCILLAVSMLLVMLAACGDEAAPEPAPAPAPVEEPPPAPADDPPADDPPANIPDIFPWDNFEGRDPNNKPDLAPNGMNIWWDNWANLRANVDGGVVEIEFRPRAFDPMDYDNFADYAARGGDWMGNWGEAINMWALDGISYCKYMTIRMAGGTGGEESKLLLHFEPEDRSPYIVLFTDLVLADGSSPSITTDMQDIVIDLEASGLPGMTNRMHIRAFGDCTIFLDEIYFSEPIAPIDTTDVDTIFSGFTVQPTAGLGEIRPSKIGVYLWDNFVDRDPDSKPELGPNGTNIWWDNWANMAAPSVEDGVARIEFTPGAFDADSFDWMGNWGEAVNMWALDGIAYAKYLVIRVYGEEGGEENKLILHFQPEDGPAFSARLSDMAGSVAITTDTMNAVVIDLEASGFPGMTNRMHIRAIADCTIFLDEIFFVGVAGALDPDAPLAGITAEPNGEPNTLPIADFIADLS